MTNEKDLVGDRPRLVANMDECLLAIIDRKTVPARALRALPPWRAVMIARLADLAETRISDGTTLDDLVAEAAAVGGAGRLSMVSVPSPLAAIGNAPLAAS